MFQLLFIFAATILYLCSNVSMNRIDPKQLTIPTNEKNSNSTSSDLQEIDHDFVSCKFIYKFISF